MIGKQFLEAQLDFIVEHSRQWIKPVIVGGVILFSVVLAFVSTINARLLLLVPVAIAGIGIMLLLLRQPAWGVVGLVAASILIPPIFDRGQFAIITPAILLEGLVLGLWVLDMVARQRRIHWVPSPTNLPLLLFLIVSFIALLNGQINYYYFTDLAPLTAQVSAFALFVLSAFAFWLVGNHITSMRWLKITVWGFIGLGSVYIWGRLIPSIEPLVYRFFQYGSDASLFWTWLFALASSQLLLNRNLNQRWRIALGAMLVAALYISVGRAYSWKSGWLPALISVAAIIFVGFPRYRQFAVIMAIVVVVLGFTKISGALTGEEDYSILTRTEAWLLVLKIVKANPILGLGPANYYWYTPLFPIEGYRVQFNSHNNYIDILAQTGIIGLGMFIWFVVELGRLAWRLKDRIPDGFARAYVIGTIGGLIGTLAAGMLGDWFLPFVYNVGFVGYRSSISFWLFCGGLVALEQLYLRREDRTAVALKP